ncbi:MAG: hypothetical protein QF449_02000 [Alphaproteobacteria bacterium]|jgi:hypothetical protein|nr:hypothetical protein [Alphaproteobacteria bacterium]MDP6590855.1 hypothetical protein [Alphaproteobacteria bacterium]MDP6816798.1 hypothetical protein [Alphaproteobacteria bacterium]|tara:strand:- start:1054 stop:1368 length:315 start_codon:yes stop_codon:yes gene_type:complete
MSKVDRKEIDKRMARISDIFSEMVAHAESLSRTRCPYRDRFDHCTAEFRCRNQNPPAAEDARHPCGHDGDFDYRSAWESQPLAHERAKKKVTKIRRDATRRRNQ